MNAIVPSTLAGSPAVLLVEADGPLRRLLRTGFHLAGFRTAEAQDWKAGLCQAETQAFELIVIDLDPTGVESQDVVGRYVSSGSAVIALSSSSRLDEKVIALDAGASDYVTIPFGVPELLARARAVVRRHRLIKPPVPPIALGPLWIDSASRLVTLNGARLDLTPKEYRLLQILAQSAGEVVTHTKLLSGIWGKGCLDASHYLRILVRRVRRKIETEPSRPRLLLSEFGVGYKLCKPGMDCGGE